MAWFTPRSNWPSPERLKTMHASSPHSRHRSASWTAARMAWALSGTGRIPSLRAKRSAASKTSHCRRHAPRAHRCAATKKPANSFVLFTDTNHDRRAVHLPGLAPHRPPVFCPLGIASQKPPRQRGQPHTHLPVPADVSRCEGCNRAPGRRGGGRVHRSPRS